MVDSPRVGAIVVGVTAVLVIAILVVYIIKENLKRSRAVSIRPVTKVHYSKGQTGGHVSIIHLSDGHGGNPTQCDWVPNVTTGDLDVRRLYRCVQTQEPSRFVLGTGFPSQKTIHSG